MNWQLIFQVHGDESLEECDLCHDWFPLPALAGARAASTTTAANSFARNTATINPFPFHPMTTPPPSTPSQHRLSEATRTLFCVAANIPALAAQFGVTLSDDGLTLRYNQVPRPWLKAHPVCPQELTFDPDLFARSLRACSDGERYCRLFILNVWNRNYAASRGWSFDLFRALSTLDYGNREGIAWFLQNPLWP